MTQFTKLQRESKARAIGGYYRDQMRRHFADAGKSQAECSACHQLAERLFFVNNLFVCQTCKAQKEINP